jgi:hypothetical protein
VGTLAVVTSAVRFGVRAAIELAPASGLGTKDFADGSSCRPHDAHYTAATARHDPDDTLDYTIHPYPAVATSFPDGK